MFAVFACNFFSGATRSFVAVAAAGAVVFFGQFNSFSIPSSSCSFFSLLTLEF